MTTATSVPNPNPNSNPNNSAATDSSTSTSSAPSSKAATPALPANVIGTVQTPAAPSTTSLSLATSVCPICSTELNELARAVPYANQSKSHVEPDLLLLPNGRAYGKARLEEHARKSGLLEGQVKDLRTGEVYGVDRLKKVYIT